MDCKNSFSDKILVEEQQSDNGTDLVPSQLETRKDYFMEKNGEKFAGLHLIIDCVGCKNLQSLDIIEACLRKAVVAANATLLHIHLHHFTPNGGISGVAVLAESHITVHSWPEHGYCALDVFMCGGADPHKTIDVIRDAFEPDELRCDELLRGKDVLAWNDGSKRPSI